MSEHRFSEPANEPPFAQPAGDAFPVDEASQPATKRGERAERTIELKEEQLFATKELREVGEIIVRTEVEEFPGRLEVDAFREEAAIEHVPVGQVVSERVEPWEENGTLVIPIYEEQLVVSKRLMLKEQLRIRRVGVTERRLFEEPLHRDRLVIDDPSQTGLVHEVYPEQGDEPPREEPKRVTNAEPRNETTGEPRSGVNPLIRKMFM